MSPAVAEEPRRRYTWFAFLYALAVFWDLAELASVTTPSLRTAALVAAAAVMLAPGSAPRFAFFLVVAVASFAQRMPDINNLGIVILATGLMMLSTLPWEWHRARRCGARPEGGRWLRDFAPLLRLSTLVVYAFAACVKLKADFMEAELGCAVAFYERIGRTAWMTLLPMPPGAPLAPLLGWGVLAVEVGLPLLLLFAATRVAGVLLGVAFHAVLGFAWFFEFSAMAIALLFLFAPPDTAGRVDAWWRRRDRRRTRIAAAATLVLFTVAVAIQAVQVWTPGESLHENVADVGRRLLWTSWWIALIPIGVFVGVLWRGPLRGRAEPAFFVPPHPALLVWPALVALNGASPYLGFKTEHSYAMYSNLRTEGGVTNHWILRRPVALAGYQTDLVEIVDSSDEKLADLAAKALPVPFYELRRRVHELAEAGAPLPQITYRRGGELRTAARPEADLLAAPSLWERKLLSFREIHPRERNPCTH